MLYLIKKDIKDIFGNKKRIGMAFLVLIIIIIGTSLYVLKPEKNLIKELRLGVINEDSSSYSKLLLEYFKTSESFSAFISVYEGSREEVREEFKEGLLDAYLCIPKGFADNLMVLNHIPVEVVINGEDKSKAILIDNILKSYEKYIKAVELNCVALYDRMTVSGFDKGLINEKNVEISYDLIFTALGKESFFEFEEIGDYNHTSLKHYLSASFLCTLILYLTFYMGLFIRKEKDSGITGRLFAAGVPVWLYLLEKLIVLSGVIVLPAIALILILKVFFSITISLLSFISFLTIVPAVISFVIFINIFFKKTSEYLLAGNFLCLFSAIFGGGFIPGMFLPDKILKISQFTPTYWMIKILLFSDSAVHTAFVYKSILHLIVVTLALYLFSLSLYKKEVGTHV